MPDQIGDILKKSRKIHAMNPNSLKNLPSMKNKTPEELQELYRQKIEEKMKQESWEEAKEKIMQEYANNYDLDDLKPNDLASLESLIHATIMLRTYESQMREISSDGTNYENIPIIEKLGKVCSELRSDISKLQDDLKITRKTRKNDKEESVLTFIDGLKEKARKFYTAKTQWIFCPKCGMLLANVWWLYPNSKSNKIFLRCQREMPDGQVCGQEIMISAKELTELGGTNKQDIPDSLK